MYNSTDILKVLARLYLFIGLTFGSTFSSLASNQNIFNGDVMNQPLYYDILMDKGSFKIEDILTSKKLRFYEIPDYLKITEPGREYWLRFRIKNNTSFALLIDGLQYFNTILYYPDTLCHYHSKCFYTGNSFFSKDIYYNEMIMEVPYSAKEETYYLKLICSKDVGMGFHLSNVNSTFNKVILNMIFRASYLGGIVFILVFNLVLFIRLFDKIYLLYAFYLLSLFLFTITSWGYVAFLNNITLPYFFPECIPYSLVTISLLLYTREFLKTYLKFKTQDYFILAAIVLKIIILCISIIFRIRKLTDPTIDNILLLPALYVSILAFSQRNKSSRFFLLSFVIIFIGLLYHATLEKQLMIDNEFLIRINKYFNDPRFFFLNFSVLEIAFFSLALAERFIDLRKQSEEGHRETIETQRLLLLQAQENETLKDTITKQLEEMVAERTLELKTANDLLKEKSQEIDEMNILLKADNISLVRHLETLQVARVMDENLSFSDFSKIFTDEAFCLLFLSDLKWKDGFHCRKCQYKRFNNGQQLLSRKCKLCGYDESPASHTLFESSKIPLNKAFYLVFAEYTIKKKNISRLAESLNLRTATCYNFIKKVEIAIANKALQKAEVINWINLLI